MNFYIMPNIHKDKELSATLAIIDYLTIKNAGIYLDASLPDYIKEKCKKAFFCSDNEIAERCDYAIIIGGDGTILKAAKKLYEKNIPIIGINLGNVGYMAELETNQCNLMDTLFTQNPNCKIDCRMMIQCNVIRNGQYVYKAVCLNEAVVAKGDVSRMIDLELIHNNQTIAEYQCDGIIASTPTGSTAYAMSAGGAIIDPQIDCISVIPLCAYLCINKSPIIFSKDKTIKIKFNCVRENSAYLTIDGEDTFKLCDGDEVEISRANGYTKLLRFKDTDFYTLLNNKLTNRANELGKK